MIKNSIIIPAYNEEAALPVVLQQLSSAVDETCEVIVVDDGSKDNTAQVARELGFKTVVHPVNMGKGAAMRTGIDSAEGEHVIFMDADNTYPTEAVLAIAGLLEEYDMVVGCRITKSNIPVFNRLGNQVFGCIFRLIYKAQVSDPLSGLYGLKRKCLELMQLTSTGFEIETEITIKAARMKLKVKEFPIHYDERIGETKLDPVRDGLQILKTIGLLLFLFNPSYGFILPGIVLFGVSLVLFCILSFAPIHLGQIRLDIHSLFFSSMSSILGFQLMTFGLISKIYATLYKNIPADRVVKFVTKARIWRTAAIVGLVSTVAGGFLILRILYAWIEKGFDPIMKLHESIFAFFFLIIGIQIVFSALFLTIFGKDIFMKQKQMEIAKQLGEIHAPVNNE
ncbi:MAG: glycosyltransferase family 2 protein [Desulfobacterales bacterium]|nr:MAG: glycosyltransferase family 2 protein [Desulfobacterales bacterium]